MLLCIWHFTAQYYPQQKGGLATHVRELASGCAQAGHHVVVFVPCRENTSVLVQMNLQLECCSWADGQSPWRVDSVRAAVHRRALDLRKVRRPTIVHCHDWHLYPVALDTAQHFGCPLVTTFHVSQAVSRYWGALPCENILATERDMCRRSTLLITVSRSMQQEIASFYKLPSAGLIRVVLNGMDLPARMRTPNHEAAEHEEELSVAVVGRMVPQKGLAELLESAPRVLDKFPNLKYILCGATGTSYEQTLRATWLIDQRMRGAVRLKAMTNKEELYAIYRSAALVVVPSRYEPFGYSALEAMMSGACVLASDHGGMPEFIENWRTGVLLPHIEDHGVTRVNVDRLVDLQRDLLGRPRTRNQIGASAREQTLRGRSRSVMVQETIALYSEVL